MRQRSCRSTAAAAGWSQAPLQKRARTPHASPAYCTQQRFANRDPDNNNDNNGYSAALGAPEGTAAGIPRPLEGVLRFSRDLALRSGRGVSRSRPMFARSAFEPSPGISGSQLQLNSFASGAVEQ
mmetsp:Transcript_72967/g.117647  ORF Transcript_72967/g.117647 Transcript_72967/m.117647 type:complete len:125 (+) Transcript_72967:444-818(+)